MKKTVVSISQDDERLEAASRWVLKMDQGKLNASDKQALGVWLDENSKHREVLLEVAAAWDKTDSLAMLADFFPHEADAGQETTVPWYQFWKQGFAPAASMALLASVLIISGLGIFNLGFDQDAHLVQYATYETAIGEQKTVLLPDGSEVVLNTNSHLSLAFTASARVLRLSRGEVHVRVAKDKTRPMSVVAGDRIVQAVGTEFTVEINKDKHVEVMVTEGKVVVGIQPVSLVASNTVNSGREKVVIPPVLAQREDNTLSAGEEVILGSSDPVKHEITADDIKVKLSWKEGSLVFRSEPLEKALQEVGRYTTVEFVLLDEGLKSKAVTGRFRAGDVEGLLESLRVYFDITHEIDEENRVLLSNF